MFGKVLLHAERVCEPAEHVAFAPLDAQPPLPGADAVVTSFSGLDHAEACWIRRLLRALGECFSLSFHSAINCPRASTSLETQPRVGACSVHGDSVLLALPPMTWFVS